MWAVTGFALVAMALADGGAPPRARAARCQLVHAILGVAHSGARSAFRDLDCVRARTNPRRLLVRATLTDDAGGGTRPLLAPGEHCPTDGYVGVDPRRLSRSRRPQSFIELRLAQRAPDRLSFSVLLETWSSKHDSGPSCGASGEGTVILQDGRWRVPR